MKRLLLVPLTVFVAATPALALWELDDASDDMGYLLIASQIDTTDTIEIQLACDEILEGDLLFSIFTGIDPGKTKDSMPPVPVTVEFGAVSFPDLTGKIVDIEGERILDISEAVDPEVKQIAQAVRKGKEMTVSFLDTEWLVPAENAADILPGVFERCP